MRCAFKKCDHAPAVFMLDDFPLCAWHAERVECLLADVAPEVVAMVHTIEPVPVMVVVP